MYGDEEKKDFPVSKKLIDWLWTKPEVREGLWEEMKRETEETEEIKELREIRDS